ncbi:cytochrome c oxidase subunit II [Noviherbaspirillum pedocola]|nr:cytochrome c oxidase subunit II [Noviherbaspirillum pedocola]
MKRGIALILSWLLAAPALADADGPMGYLQTHARSADPVTRLNWGLIAISVLVMVIITALLLAGMLRKRGHAPRDGNGMPEVMPDTGGASWIYIGTGVSGLVLFGVAIWVLMVLSAVAAPAGKPGLTIEVAGRQWWWEVRYLGSDVSKTLVTANEIHIPVGVPVHVRLVGGDVIHSFWIPKLAGKTDMIPGQTNTTWLQADKPGVYRGQCGEFCGAQHAHMALYVVAQDGPAFDAWMRAQLADPPVPAGGMALRGSQVFLEHCAVCHAVRGSLAGGRLGPDLTHLMSRATIAAGTLPNNLGNLEGWIANAQGIKPGSRMPPQNLSPEDLHAVTAYLQTLE